jgi:hypothetical protein
MHGASGFICLYIGYYDIRSSLEAEDVREALRYAAEVVRELKLAVAGGSLVL